MPFPVAPKELEPFFLDREPLIESTDELTAEAALSLVCRSFEHWEAERQTSHDSRWHEARNLYLGLVTKRFWDSRRLYPKAAVSIRTTYDQITTAYPVMATALFGKQPWFEVIDATSPASAEAKRQRLCYVLESPGKDGISAVAHLKKSLRNHFLPYGVSFAQVGYDSERLEPWAIHLDPRDVYVPPGVRGTVDNGSGWILRKEISIAELKKKASDDFDVPPDDVLYYLALNRSADAGDQARDLSEALRAISPTSLQHEINPADDKVEVLIYETPERIVWVLGRKWIAYNEKNPYGMMTLVSAPYSDTGDGIYGEGIPDLIGQEQKLQQTYTNASLDEISLALNPPLGMRSQNSRPDQTVYRPGQKFPVAQGDEIQTLGPQRVVTGDALAAIGMSDLRAQRRTGMNAMAQQGTPTPSNANRTATGVSAQSSATSMRLLEPIQNFEEFLVVPLLMKLDRIMTMMETRSEAPGYAGGQQTSVPTELTAAPNKFKLFGSTRLRSRDALMPILPLLLQYYMNPEIAKQLQKTGKTIDHGEINRMIEDTADIGERYQIVRDMNEQETQQASQADEQNAEMQEKMMELQVRQSIAQQGNETKLKAERIKAQSKGEETAEKSATSLSTALLKLKEKRLSEKNSVPKKPGI